MQISNLFGVGTCTTPGAQLGKYVSDNTILREQFVAPDANVFATFKGMDGDFFNLVGLC